MFFVTLGKSLNLTYSILKSKQLPRLSWRALGGKMFLANKLRPLEAKCKHPLPSPPQERLKVGFCFVFSCTAFLPFSSGLLVQMSSLFSGNLVVNGSSLVVNHCKLAIALACRAWEALVSSFQQKISCGLWPIYLEVTLPSIQKIGKAYSFIGLCPGLGHPHSFGKGFFLLPFFFSALTSANILVAVVLCTDTN